ncbi:MAG: LPS assembly protein LptD [Caulobacterales bacterium]
MLEADIVSEEKTPHRVIAEGDVEAIYQGRVLRADRVVYNMDTKRVHASGNVQITEADGATRYADEVEVDDKLGNGVATGFAAKLPQNATVIANSAIRKEGDKTLLGQVIYTGCPICDAAGKPTKPTWTLRARRATQNVKTKMISYRDAVVEIHGVPVFYTPYFTHADPTAGRRSGLLPPSVSQNSALGFSYGQPYYWAISPSQELTIEPRYHSEQAPSVGAEYRKRFYSGDLEVEGSATNARQFDSGGDKFGNKEARGHVFANGVWDINPDWKWGFGIEETSDDLYPIRYKISGEDKIRGPFQTRPRSLIDQLYVEGRDDSSSTLISAMKFNDLTIPRDSATLPLVLPYLSYLKRIESPILGGDVSLDLNSASLTRSDGGTDSRRATAGLAWNRRDILGPGIVVEPFAEGRGDYFKITDYPAADDSESFGRGYASVGSVVRWPFQRTGAVDVIVEPIGMVAVGTKSPNDARIPNEDSPSFELDETSVFHGNAAPNYDVIEGGTRASFGLRVSAKASNGIDGSAFIGRRWRTSDDSTFTEASNLGRTASDYLAAIETNFGSLLSANVRLRLDGDDFSVRRIDAGVRTNVGPLTLGTRYYKYDEALVGTTIPPEQAQLYSALKLNKNFSFNYSITRDFKTNTNRYQRIGLVYSDICTTIGVFYSRDEIQNRQFGPSEGIVLQITLATLGSIGTD